MQKFKVSGQSVPKIEWKQTDRCMEAIALSPMLMRLVLAYPGSAGKKAVKRLMRVVISDFERALFQLRSKTH